MPTLGVNIGIVEAGRLLLTLREDFPVWCLPGGAVDDWESLAEAARREAAEETGLEITLTRLVGIYSRPARSTGGNHEVLFAATPVGGTLLRETAETRDARTFAREDLPDHLLWWHRRRCFDVLDGAQGLVVRQDVPRMYESRRELYRQRDSGELDVEAFVHQMITHPGPAAETVESAG